LAGGPSGPTSDPVARGAPPTVLFNRETSGGFSLEALRGKVACVINSREERCNTQVERHHSWMSVQDQPPTMLLKCLSTYGIDGAAG